jgi:hypothetical protein
LTASSNGVHQASEGRDALGVRIEVLAIFLSRKFSQCFLLDDFALRTILKTALNIAMHRSRDVLNDRSERFFASQGIFTHGARTLSGSGREVHFAWGFKQPKLTRRREDAEGRGRL